MAPNGTVFRNDDRNGAADRRPLVKIASAPNNGSCTVHVAQFAGAATETNIVLLYGRYPRGNANCGGATGPTLAADSLTTAAEELDDLQKVDGPAPAPKRGQPGARSLVTDVAASAERPRGRARSFTRCRDRVATYTSPRGFRRGGAFTSLHSSSAGYKSRACGQPTPPARCASQQPGHQSSISR